MQTTRGHFCLPGTSLIRAYFFPPRRQRFRFRIFFGLIVLFCLLHRALATDPVNPVLQIPRLGDTALHILSPNVLELLLMNTRQPNLAMVNSWNWLDTNNDFTPPDMSSVQVIVDGQFYSPSAIGFKRRPLYAPQGVWDLRIANDLYLQLTTPISPGQSVQVVNDGTVWPTNLIFAATADPLRYNPAIHVNQEGYMPIFPKKAIVGYYLGNMGELPIATTSFSLVNVQSGATVYQGAMTLRPDIGYQYSPTPYQLVCQADFSSFTNTGQYQVVVPGMGASLPFQINDGIGMDFARIYALGNVRAA